MLSTLKCYELKINYSVAPLPVKLLPRLTMNHVKKIIRHSLFLSAIVRSIRFFISRDYRHERSLIATRPSFFYFYGRALALTFWPFLKAASVYLKVKKIFISVNNISAVGHIYPEIDALIRILDTRYLPKDAIIWYVMPGDPLLFGARMIFQRERLRLKLNGFLHLFLNLVMLVDSRQALCVSLSTLNYVNDIKNTTLYGNFMIRHVRRARFLAKKPNYFPIRRFGETINVVSRLTDVGISGPYVVIQIKDRAVNATFQPVDPDTYISSIKHLQKKGYLVVFAGREKMPQVFVDLGVFNYSESRHASPFYDYLLVFGACLVIGSASGFVDIPESLGKPLLSINSWHHVTRIGQKTIVIPTLLRRRGQGLTFEEQRLYAFSSMSVDNRNLPLDKNEICAVDAAGIDILDGTIEILDRINRNDWSYTDLQEKSKKINRATIYGVGMSRISHNFIEKHRDVFLA